MYLTEDVLWITAGALYWLRMVCLSIQTCVVNTTHDLQMPEQIDLCSVHGIRFTKGNILAGTMMQVAVRRSTIQINCKRQRFAASPKSMLQVALVWSEQVTWGITVLDEIYWL